jgi:putative acetyltransferase
MITISRTDSDNPDFQKLTRELDIELCKIYNTRPEDFEEYNRITNLKTVLLVYDNGHAVACGCFKEFDKSTVELKRMYVIPAFRGRGIASAMVAELETWAQETGHRAAILETGKKQSEAISMYHKSGYSRIPAYSKETESENSVCMKKQLIVPIDPTNNNH